MSDRGGGFDPAAVPDPRLPENVLKPSGRGVFLMRALMDEARFNEAGNEVTLVLRNNDAGEGAPGRAGRAAVRDRGAGIREDAAADAMAREMQLAHDLQMKLLPPLSRVRGVEAAARVVPAESVGGDFYQVLQLSGRPHGSDDRGRVGTRFPAALIMALVMSAAAMSAQQGGAPAAVLESLDSAVGEELESTEMYLSLFYCVMSPGRAELAYANAGHPHAFVIDPGGTARRLPATDPPMGIEGAPFRESSAKWAPGEDLLLLFTDGLSDTVARRGPDVRRGPGPERGGGESRPARGRDPGPPLRDVGAGGALDPGGRPHRRRGARRLTRPPCPARARNARWARTSWSTPTCSARSWRRWGRGRANRCWRSDRGGAR